MAETTVVELVCKTEDKLVARVETKGSLTAQAIHKGIKVLDRGRVPRPRSILDGVQMVCTHCFEPLWFRGANGDLYAAMPGSLVVEA